MGSVKVALPCIISLAGVLLFALFAHSTGWSWLLAIIALIIVSVTIAASFKKIGLRETIGTSYLSAKTLIYSAVGICVGITASVGFLCGAMETSFFKGITSFACVAGLIGLSEEFLFRGFIQGRLRKLSRYGSLLIAVLGHTVYKCLLFHSQLQTAQMDPLLFISWTIAGSTVCGFLREGAGNIVPPVLAHSIFDVAVYGGNIEAPWWVWG